MDTCPDCPLGIVLTLCLLHESLQSQQLIGNWNVGKITTCSRFVYDFVVIDISEGKGFSFGVKLMVNLHQKWFATLYLVLFKVLSILSRLHSGSTLSLLSSIT